MLLITFQVPWEQALDLLVVPNTMEDKHIEWSQAFPWPVKDHRCIEFLLGRTLEFENL